MADSDSYLVNRPSYILYKGQKRITLKEDDMIGVKIARIFQVYPPSLYITDEENVAIFPTPDGHFSCLDLRPRGHYEVNGDDIALPVADQSPPAPALAPGGSGQNRFQFQRPSKPTAALGPPAQAATLRATINSIFKRAVTIADVHQGKLRPIRTLSVNLFEFEATIAGVLAKIYEAIQSDEPLILTDSNGIEIVDCEGTRGSSYWKASNASKFYAVPEPILREFQQGTKEKKDKRQSLKGTSQQEVHDKMEEVGLAAQALSEVTAVLNEQSTFASNFEGAMLVLSDTTRAPIKEAFGCVVCEGIMKEPMFAVCCKSIVACKTCVEKSILVKDECVNCSVAEFSGNVHRVTGLDNVLATLGGVI